jgi:predicted acyltransferase
MYYVDFLHKRTGIYFFEVFGKNPLFIYLVSELSVIILYMININGTSLYQWLYQNIFSTAALILVAAIRHLLYVVLLACWLYT